MLRHELFARHKLSAPTVSKTLVIIDRKYGTMVEVQSSIMMVYGSNPWCCFITVVQYFLLFHIYFYFVSLEIKKMFILVVENFFSHLPPSGIEPETLLRKAIQVMPNVTHKWMSLLQLNFNNCPI